MEMVFQELQQDSVRFFSFSRLHTAFSVFGELGVSPVTVTLVMGAVCVLCLCCAKTPPDL
jgi:hypothetical protein